MILWDYGTNSDIIQALAKMDAEKISSTLGVDVWTAKNFLHDVEWAKEKEERAKGEKLQARKQRAINAIQFLMKNPHVGYSPSEISFALSTPEDIISPTSLSSALRDCAKKIEMDGYNPNELYRIELNDNIIYSYGYLCHMHNRKKVVRIIKRRGW